MGKQKVKPNYRRRSLRLPDLDHMHSRESKSSLQSVRKQIVTATTHAQSLEKNRLL